MTKTIKFGSWSELKRAIPGYERLGYKCEVVGWEGMRHNILTISDSIENNMNERAEKI